MLNWKSHSESFFALFKLWANTWWIAIGLLASQSPRNPKRSTATKKETHFQFEQSQHAHNAHSLCSIWRWKLWLHGQLYPLPSLFIPMWLFSIIFFVHITSFSQRINHISFLYFSPFSTFSYSNRIHNIHLFLYNDSGYAI